MNTSISGWMIVQMIELRIGLMQECINAAMHKSINASMHQFIPSLRSFPNARMPLWINERMHNEQLYSSGSSSYHPTEFPFQIKVPPPQEFLPYNSSNTPSSEFSRPQRNPLSAPASSPPPLSLFSLASVFGSPLNISRQPLWHDTRS